MPEFFTSTHRWYACDRCKRYYAFTMRQLIDEEEHCPHGHSISDGYRLSKQWQELTSLWGLFTALYFEQWMPVAWVSYAQFELAASFQQALKNAQGSNP